MTQPSGQVPQAAAQGTTPAVPPVARRPRALYVLLTVFVVDMVLNTAAAGFAVLGAWGAMVLGIGAALIAAARIAAFVGLWKGNGTAREFFAIGNFCFAGALAVVATIGFALSGDEQYGGVILALRTAAIVFLLLGGFLGIGAIIREWCAGGTFHLVRRPGQRMPVQEEPEQCAGLGEWTARYDWGWAADVPIVRIGGLNSEPFVETKHRRCRTLIWGSYQGMSAMVAQVRFIRMVPMNNNRIDRRVVHRAQHWDVVCAVLETGTPLPELTVRQKKNTLSAVQSAVSGDNVRGLFQSSNVALPQHSAGGLFFARSDSGEFAQRLVTPQLMDAMAPSEGTGMFNFNFRFTGDKVLVWTLLTADMRPEFVESQIARAYELFRQSAPLARTAPASEPAFDQLHAITGRLLS